MKSPTPSRPQKMALIPACIFLCFAALSVQAEETPVTPQPPDILLGPLFNDVQNAKLFPDQKTFADAVPNSDPLMILADYRMQQNQSGFDLRHFVNVNFTLPKEGEKYVPPEGQSLREHIDGLWPVLTRSTENTEKWDSLLPLPEPYVVPGGRFREVYYWDSYFTMLGLAESGHWDKVADMVANFAHEIDTYGHIPNGNRSYYLSRSQPPFFALMVELLAQHEGDAALKQYLPQMQKEYAYWMDGVENLQAGQQEKRVVKLQDGTLLNRYWDDRDTPRDESWLEDVETAKHSGRPPNEVYRDLRAGAASGWDYSSRWLRDTGRLASIRTTQFIPIDLNAFLFKLESAIANISALKGEKETEALFRQKASARRDAVNRYLWDDENGIYRDYDWRREQLALFSAAAIVPLYVGMANHEQADRLANAVRSRLLTPGGILASEYETGEQWDKPNGWAPLQWMAIQGFKMYGDDLLGDEIARSWLKTVNQFYLEQHKLIEKYHIADGVPREGGGGEYPLQDGFGWTNGVVRRLIGLYGEP